MKRLLIIVFLLVPIIIVDGYKDANLEMVVAGYAWHYKEYQREQHPDDRRLYAAAEIKARNEKKGLWSTANLFHRGNIERIVRPRQ